MPRQKPRPAPTGPPADKVAPDAKQQAFRFPPGRMTPEQLAKSSVAKRPSPPGLPDLAEITLRLAPRRDALEPLTARAIRQGQKLEAIIRELPEHAAEE